MKDINDPEEYNSRYILYDDIFYSEDCKKLASTSAYDFETDNYGFTAKVKRDKESLVFFSVPFDKGWSATVNGKPVEIEKVNVGFMAVKVDEGDSNIRFSYQTPGLKYGLFITALSGVIFALYILIFALYNRKHKAKTVYPEGDVMLHDWLAEESKEDLPEIPKKEKKSILDDTPSIDIPNINPGFEGGFKIDSSIFEEDK